MKKTCVVGASVNPGRYAYIATHQLLEKGHEVVLLSNKTGELFNIPILDIHKKPVIDNVDTITMYLNPSKQKEWYEYLLSLNPARIIFNPGSENSELKTMAENSGFETLEACTLVMLQTDRF